MTKTVLHRIVDAFPAVVVGLWAGLFASTGTTLPIAGEGWWQLSAFVVAVANLSVAVFVAWLYGRRPMNKVVDDMVRTSNE